MVCADCGLGTGKWLFGQHRRCVSAGADELVAHDFDVRVDGEVVDRAFLFKLGSTHVCQAGKKAFARVTLKAE